MYKYIDRYIDMLYIYTYNNIYAYIIYIHIYICTPIV